MQRFDNTFYTFSKGLPVVNIAQYTEYIRNTNVILYIDGCIGNPDVMILSTVICRLEEDVLSVSVPMFWMFNELV